MLGNILGAVTGIGKTYLEGRQKVRTEAQA